MPIGILFWVLMIIWLVFGFYAEYVPGQPYPFARGGRHFLTFVMFLVVGWKVFGPPIH